MNTCFCKKCNITFHPNGLTAADSTCPYCGERAEMKSELYWCDDCNIPLYDEVCPRCSKSGHSFTSDARPVFPEERLLLEVLLEKPLAFINDSVWNGTGNRYYVNGKRIAFSVAKLNELDPDQIRAALVQYMPQNNYVAFDAMIERWIEANSIHFGHITDEAREYIRYKAARFMNDDTCAMFLIVWSHRKKSGSEASCKTIHLKNT